MKRRKCSKCGGVVFDICKPITEFTYTFGSFWQKKTKDEGKQPLEWIILERRKNGELLLITKDIIDYREFYPPRPAHSDPYVGGTWKDSNIREWLNGTFLKEAFSREEQERIIEVANANKDDDRFQPDGGGATTDKVFLFSNEEVNYYFTFRTVRRGCMDLVCPRPADCGETEYAMEQRDDDQLANTWGLRTCNINDAWDTLTVNNYASMTVHPNIYGITIVDPRGPFGKLGVRPVILIKPADDLKEDDVPDFITSISRCDCYIYDPAERKVPKTDLVTGDYLPFRFGKYQQDREKYVAPRPICWRVLEVRDDGTLLLISDKILEVKRYTEDDGEKGVWESLRWSESYMRKWLNEVFINEAFSPKEQKCIVEVTNANKDRKEVFPDREYIVKGGGDTQDRVFLLSDEEIEKYPEVNMATLTDHCRVGAYSKENNWWLRSLTRCPDPFAVKCVESDGCVNNVGWTGLNGCGVRPAVVVDLAKLAEINQ
ncbi:MAG: DUF6273 domain-containing protein [Lachnospiraceae bacterium]|nr:DUF6273 domain-containing protein [Lachnospiraceae bacterium]